MALTTTALAACTAALLTTATLGHGSMDAPVSRVRSIYLANPEQPVHAAHVDAVASCGTQPFYDWHELSRTNSDYGSNLFAGGSPNIAVYRDMIPDGQLASAGRSKYACLDMARDDWPATNVQSGAFTFQFYAHVVHEPNLFHAWISRSDYDATQPLTWDDLEALPISTPVRDGMIYSFDADLPQRDGRHVLYVAWQRIDPAGEVFFSLSDVTFDGDGGDDGGDGGDDGDGDDGGDDGDGDDGGDDGDDGGDDGDDGDDDGDAPQTGVVDFSLVNAWGTGYTADVRFTLASDADALQSWSISWAGTPAVDQAWNCVLSVDATRTALSNPSWNPVIQPGDSVSMGFTGNGSWPPSPMDVQVNGQGVSMSIDGEGGSGGGEPDAPCPMDLDGNTVVDVQDVLVLLLEWGPCPGCAADLDGNGVVGISDVLAMLGAFGPCGSTDGDGGGGGDDGGGDDDDGGDDGGGDDDDGGDGGDGGDDGGGGDGGGDDGGGGNDMHAKRIVAYYIEWGIYGRDYQPADIPLDKVTHVNYAFANIDEGGRIAIGDPWAAVDRSYPGDTWDQPYRGTYNQLNNVLRAQYPHIKTLISVGGWTWSGRFSDVALTDASRERFAESAVDFIRAYNFDGVDVDWEYPVCCGLGGNVYRPEDSQNYTLLMQELRTQLDDAEGEDGREYLLTIAAAGGVDKLEHYELTQLADTLDWINVMAYDFMGAWDLSITGHHSGLYANEDNPSGNVNVREHYNADGAIQPWLDAGVNPDQIVLGVPFYGRAWGGVAPHDGGLFQPGSMVPPGTWDDWSSGATGVNDYFEIQELLASGGYTVHRDAQAKVPWAYNPDVHGGHFISYDDAISMQHKVDYVNDLGLGGVMFWEVTADRNETLLDVIVDGLP